MSAIDYASIILLIFLLGAQTFWRPLLVSRQKKIIAWIIIIFAAAIFLSIRSKFLALQSSTGFTGYLIPPYQPINYLLFTAFLQFILPYLISGAAAIMFIAWTRSISSERRSLIFEPDEPFVAALAIFLVGHPLWILYLIAMAIAGLARTLLNKHKRVLIRTSVYKLWLPIAIATYLASPWLLEIPFVKVLRLM